MSVLASKEAGERLGWTRVRLGDVLPLEYGKALPSRARDDTGSVPVFGSSGTVGFHSSSLTQSPVIVVGRKGSAGAIHFGEEACWPIDTAYYADDFSALHPRFAYHLLTYLRLSELDQSTAIPSLSREIYNAVEVEIPLSRDEQSRIAARIDALFEQIGEGEAELREARKLLNVYRQSVLKAAVTGELTANWRDTNPQQETGADLLTRVLARRREEWIAGGKSATKYKEPMAAATAALQALPDGWAWASLDQLLVLLTSGSRAWAPYYDRGTGTFIMAQNVWPLRADWTFRQAVDPPEQDAERKRTQVRNDDLLATIVGANTGDVCRVDRDLAEHYVCQSVALMRPSDVRLSEWINLCLNAPGPSRKFMNADIYGAGRPHLSFETLRAIPIPVPSLAELAIIEEGWLSKAVQLDALQRDLTAAGSASTALRQAVLAAAFAGRL